MSKVNITKARTLAKKYATASPDRMAQAKYVTYSDDRITRPECIVGQILVNDLGVDSENAELTSYAAAAVVAGRLGIELSKGAAVYLNIVQRFQDGRAYSESQAVGNGHAKRETWANAVALTDAYFDQVGQRKAEAQEAESDL